ncbi:MAG TPA: TonB-dependent receptor, partial [Aeromonadales bacterium]|nr:TonB-dependent receptor [Aeromonadales bacterium]
NGTTTRGGEFSLNYQINKQLNLYAFFAHINIENTTLKATAESRYDQTAPKNSGGLMLNKQWNNGLNASLVYYNVGDMDWGDRTGTRSAQAYQKLDLRIARTIRMGSSIMELALLGQNLYENFSDYNNTTFNNDGSLNRAGSLQERKFYIDIKVSF